MPFPINIWLVHPEKEMCKEFEKRFCHLPNVSIFKSKYEDLNPHDCFVTAGNCYGIMTAGIDAALVNFHGQELMEKVQNKILETYLGEQPIGTCFLIETGNIDYPYVAHSPTMRVPNSIKNSDKVYLATFAAFQAVYNYNLNNSKKIKTIVFPAMGTGFGDVEYSESARQMATAYEHYLSPPHRFDWDQVILREKHIKYDGNKKVVY